MRRSRNGPWIGSAIWLEQPIDADTGDLASDEFLRAVVGHRASAQSLAAEDVETLWIWVAKNPVPYEDYRAYYESGAWPSDPLSATSNRIASDHCEALFDQIKAAAGLAEDIAEISNQSGCDRAANIRDRLNALAKHADAERVRLKQPHDDAAKAIHTTWKPWIDLAKSAADDLRPKLTCFLQARQNELFGSDDPQTARAGGASGRRTGLRSEMHIEISDYEVVLHAVKHESDVQDAVAKAARRLARAGIELPGVTIRKERVAA